MEYLLQLSSHSGKNLKGVFVGALSDKIRMVAFNLIVTVAVTRNRALWEVVVTWPCLDGGIKASFTCI